MALLAEHHTPPPVSDGDPTNAVEEGVAPFRKVNPLNDAPFVNHAQRTANGPVLVEGSHAPSIAVAANPFTLVTVKALSRATRLVKSPASAFPPKAYTPFVTSTISPSAPALMAS